MRFIYLRKKGSPLKNYGKYYTIGEISDMCEVPIKTLRYYDEIGLLVPSMRSRETNYRYYGSEQTLTLFIIKKLNPLVFPLTKLRLWFTAAM